MLLFAQQVTPRLQYIFTLLAREFFNEPVQFTTDPEVFGRYTGIGINYSKHPIRENEFFIQSAHLLFETDIREQQLYLFEQNGYKAFFQTGGDMGFDVLAASFYLVSRYEEYLPFQEDAYGRYPHTSSLACKEEFIHLPLVNIWLKDLRRMLQQKYPGFYFHRPGFKFLATYDIDIAYSYQSKGWLRNLGGAIRALLHGEWTLMLERIRVLNGKQKDPFDAYEWLDALHLYCMPKAYYFFLVADKTGAYDKNIHPSKQVMQRLINYSGAGYTVGIHPSWQSGDKEPLLKEEIQTLETIAGKKVTHSRQHYIRLTLPQTYRKLLEAGIKKDFSMGYGSINGFRASIASSFNWYDLQKETTTDLVVYPFCFMDANAYYEQQLSPRQAFDEMMYYYYTVKKVNGLMITIWHNHFLGTDSHFKGWREVYEIFLKEEVYWDR